MSRPGLANALGAVLIVIALAFVPPAAPRAFGPAGTSAIAGRVVDAATRQPIRGANVEVSSVPESPWIYPIVDCCGITAAPLKGDFSRSVTTDAAGRFVFADLPARAMEIRAEKAGWLPAAWGQSSPDDGARWIELGDDQRADGLEVALSRVPVIGGRVVDERGEPVGGLGIMVTPVAASAALAYPSLRTDDRGVFRGEVRPGEYYVSSAAWPGTASALWERLPVALLASPDSSLPTSAFPRVFYSQAASIDGAARLVLGPGDQKLNLDFAIRPERVFTVTVTCDADGPDPVVPMGITLFAETDRAPGRQALAVADSIGRRASFRGVPPGRYVVRMLTLPRMPRLMRGSAPPLADLPRDHTWWAEESVTVVDQDVEVRLRLQMGARITGRVEFDGASAPPALAELNGRALVVERADGAESDFRGVFLPGGRFATIQVEPGRYIVRPEPPQDWRLKSVMAGGRDVRDEPIELSGSDVTDAVITFTDRRSAIAGRIVRDGAGDQTRGWVTVFPADRAHWREYGVFPRRMAFIECGRSGLFEADVPPGTYFVVATRWSTRGRLSLEQWAQLAASAATVTVADGQTAQVAVRFSRGR